MNKQSVPGPLENWIKFLRNHGKDHVVHNDNVIWLDPPDSPQHRLDAILFGTPYKIVFNETTFLDAILFGTPYKIVFNETTFMVYVNTDNIALLVDVYNNPLNTTSTWEKQSNKTTWPFKR